MVAALDQQSRGDVTRNQSQAGVEPRDGTRPLATAIQGQGGGE